MENKKLHSRNIHFYVFTGRFYRSRAIIGYGNDHYVAGILVSFFYLKFFIHTFNLFILKKRDNVVLADDGAEPRKLNEEEAHKLIGSTRCLVLERMDGEVGFELFVYFGC